MTTSAPEANPPPGRPGNAPSSPRRLWIKRSLIAVSILVLGTGALIFFTVRHTQDLLPDLYAQWAAAELVVAHRKDKNQMPADWRDLKPYDSQVRHRGGLSFEDIERRIEIAFPRLPELELAYATPAEIPEIIGARSGVQSHWEGAEPNQLVNRELRTPAPSEATPAVSAPPSP